MYQNMKKSSNFEEQSKCSFCRVSSVIKKTLSCYHIFCDNCFKTIKVTDEKEAEGYVCPLCFTFSLKSNCSINNNNSTLSKTTSTNSSSLGQITRLNLDSLHSSHRLNLDSSGGQHHYSFNNVSRSVEITGRTAGSSLNNGSDLSKSMSEISQHSTELSIDRYVDIAVERIEQLEKSVAYYEEHIQKLKQHYQTCKQRYQTMFNSLVQEAEKQLDENVRELELSFAQNAAKINETVKKIKQEISDVESHHSPSYALQNGDNDQEWNEVNLQLPLVNENTQMKVSISTKKPLLGVTTFKPSVISIESSYDCSRQFNCSIVDVLPNMSAKEDITTLPDKKVYRMNAINNEIWIGSNDEKNRRIFVYDQAGEKVREIKCKEINTPKVMQQVDTDSVIVASHNGLHVMDVNGMYRYKIKYGHFTDVGTDGVLVAAVASVQRRVMIITQINNLWMIKMQFTLHDPDEKLKTIHVFHDCIYIAVHFQNTIYKYNVQGELIEEYGREVVFGREISKFSAPFLCGTDNEGGVVVCDRNNSCIKVMDRRGKWNRFKSPNLTWPIDLLVIGDFVFVLWENAQYVKFIARFKIKD